MTERLIDKPVSQFLTELASSAPAPGGGSVAALSGALGAALVSMVCNLTVGKKKYADVQEEIKAILDLYDDLIIQQPIPSTLIQGDILVIQGLTRFAPNDQLIVELINKDGGQVGSGIIDVLEEDLGFGYHPFDGKIPFQVGSSSWIRVQVIAKDGNFSGIQHLSSVEVLVSP